MSNSTLKLAFAAAFAWVALAVLLAYLESTVQGSMSSPVDTARRLGQLGAEYAAWLLAPVLVVTLVYGPFLQQWAHGFDNGLRVSLIGFIGSALLWAGIGFAYAGNGVNPWEHLPGVTPPYLKRFIAEHPKLEVEKTNGSRKVFLRARGQGGMWVDGNLLAGARAQLERCTAPPTAEELGGLPLFPRSVCSLALTLTRPGIPPRVIYEIELPREVDLLAKVKAFYLDWAKTREAEASFNGGPRHFDFEASSGGKKWNLLLMYSSGTGTLHIERGGRAQRWPEEEQALDR